MGTPGPGRVARRVRATLAFALAALLIAVSAIFAFDPSDDRLDLNTDAVVIAALLALPAVTALVCAGIGTLRQTHDARRSKWALLSFWTTGIAFSLGWALVVGSSWDGS